MLRIYLLTNETVGGWDTFHSCVVAATDEASARLTHPGGSTYVEGKGWCFRRGQRWVPEPHREWPDPKDVVIVSVGVADEHVKAGIISKSFISG
jgi:hypothetical protein